MQDDVDAMLQGIDQPSATPAQNAGQGDDSGQNTTPEQQTPEEIEFNKLHGSTRDRVRQLVREKREWQEKAMQGQNLTPYVPPAPTRNPQVDDAVRQLSDVGITTDEKMNKALDEKLNQLRWDQDQMRLESKYGGSEGEPQYVREEVEDYIEKHPQYRGYSAEDVFRDHMFRSEFLNLEFESKRSQKPRQTSSLKPTSRAATGEEPMSVEYIMERTDINKYPDAVEWQEEHKSQIDKVLSQMQQ